MNYVPMWLLFAVFFCALGVLLVLQLAVLAAAIMKKKVERDERKHFSGRDCS